jgi:hypothetical protein
MPFSNERLDEAAFSTVLEAVQKYQTPPTPVPLSPHTHASFPPLELRPATTETHFIVIYNIHVIYLIDIRENAITCSGNHKIVQGGSNMNGTICV